MCKFKSGIVVKSESDKGGFKLMMSPWTESHSELEIIHKLRDGARLTYAKVEFVPKDMAQAHLIETYTLNIDEERRPDWFDEDIERLVTEKMAAYVKGIIITGDVELLVGGQFIIAPGAKIESAHTMVINAMCGGTLNDMCGGTLNDMCGGTLNDMWGGTLNDIKEFFDGIIKTIHKSAVVVKDSRKPTTKKDR